MTTAKRPPGRPVVAEADRLRIGTIRLTLAQWDKLARLGGVEWLRARIDKAKVRLAMDDGFDGICSLCGVKGFHKCKVAEQLNAAADIGTPKEKK